MSQVVLAPIQHKDAYTRAVEVEVVAYFREAIFHPLLIQLLEAGVPVDPKYQRIEFDEEGRENAKAMVMYDRGLGIPRAEMPQVEPEDREALVAFLATRCVGYREVFLRPGRITPSQDGYHPEAVERGRAFLGQDERPLLLSSGLGLLDGHHRWTTADLYAPDTPLRCWVFDRPARTMLRLMDEFASQPRENAAATSAVRAALESGRIHYADGKFTGRFSSAISKELRAFGAVFNASQKTFSIQLIHLPLDLSASIADSIGKSRHLHEDVIQTLVQMEANLPAAPVGLGVSLSSAVDRILSDAGRQLVASVAQVDGVAVPAEFTPAMRAQLKEQLTDSLELSVRGFTEEMVRDLRALVEENAFQGLRTDKLARIIEAKFGVAKRKADFLADQETGLLMAKYRQARYEDLGVQEYVWSTSHDVRVRKDHERLDGKRFSFSSPPVTNLATGARNNPGEDYRCRCVPKAILNLVPAVK